MNSNTKIVYDSRYTRHLTGLGHPECPERVNAIIVCLEELKLGVLQPRKADTDDLYLCHTKDYVDLVEKECLKGVVGQLSTGDVNICEDSYDIALLAVGSVLTAIDAVMNGEASTVFCVVRPPGHHAKSCRGMGFCLFNNVAIGARYAQKKYGLKRIAIIDWDVHHGNGTEEIFRNDPSVLYFSTHQSPFYPFTGESGTGNYPVPAGSKDKILDIYRKKLPTLLSEFQPNFILISAGFDAHRDDLIGGCQLEHEDFTTLTEIVKKEAKKYTGGRLVSALEGGYNLDALPKSCLAHVKGLVG